MIERRIEAATREAVHVVARRVAVWLAGCAVVSVVLRLLLGG